MPDVPADLRGAAAAARSAMTGADAARRGASSLRDLADDVRRHGERASATAAADWRSPAAELFRQRVLSCGRQAWDAASSLDSAADALQVHAARTGSALEELEELVRRLGAR